MFIQAEQVHVTLHYYRFDGNYDGWNIWAWPYGREGAEHRFSESGEFGITASFTVDSMEHSPKIGFIIRKSVRGNEWDQREIGDRYIEWADADGSSEVWIIQGDARVYEDERMAHSRKTARIVSAVMTDENTIEAALNVPCAASDPDKVRGMFSLTDITEDGRKVNIEEAVAADQPETSVGARMFHIRTEHPMDVSHEYILHIAGWEPSPVTLTGMFDSPQFVQAYTYEGDDLGASCSPTLTSFRLWAPTATEAVVMLYDSWDAAEGRGIPMGRAEHGTWKADVGQNLHGQFYTYLVRVAGEWNEATDPYANALSVNGLKGAILDMTETNPPGWESDTRPPLPHPVDSVIYELHVRDATVHPLSGVRAKGKYAGLAERETRTPNGEPTSLDYIAGLGVTHVQLLPVADFVSVDETADPPRSYNWGYDPGHYNAPEGSYACDAYDPAARIRELKSLVQAMHAKGLRVVMDVVYNHMFSADRSNLGALVPGYYFRYLPDGRPSDGTGVGNDTASERPMMRKLIVDSVVRWARQYHIDGFRFDLMGIHDVETMNAVRASLDRVDPSILVYGEGWSLPTALDENEKASQRNAHRMPQIGQFHDKLRDGLKGSVFRARERGFVNGGGIRAEDVKSGIAGGIRYGGAIAGFASEPEQTVNFAEVHDNHTLWDKLLLSNPDDSEQIRMRMHRLATAIVLTSQGIPFLHAGQEFFRTKGGEHNSYRSPDDMNRLDWERMEAHKDTVEYVKGLIAIRKTFPALRMRTAEQIRRRLRFHDSSKGTILYTLKGQDDDGTDAQTVAVAHNGNRSPADIVLPEAVHGRWKLLCDGVRAGIVPLAECPERKFTVPALATCVWLL